MNQPQVATYKMIVREQHLDTFGHVNNATYLQLYEEARWELITQRGYSLAVVQQKGQGPVILEINLKFIKELRLREEIQIETSLLEYNSKVGKLFQRIINARGDVAAEAIFTFALFDTKARKIIEPTEEWKRAVGLTS